MAHFEKLPIPIISRVDLTGDEITQATEMGASHPVVAKGRWLQLIVLEHSQWGVQALKMSSLL